MVRSRTVRSISKITFFPGSPLLVGVGLSGRSGLYRSWGGIGGPGGLDGGAGVGPGGVPGWGGLGEKKLVSLILILLGLS